MDAKAALMEDLRRDLPFYRPGAPLPDGARTIEVTADMSGITHEMLVRYIYDRVRDPLTRKHLARLPMDSEELSPVYDAMLASMDFLLQWRYGCTYARRGGTVTALVPDAMAEEDIAGYIEDIERFFKEAFRTIGAETSCTSHQQKK